jgi:putative transposase
VLRRSVESAQYLSIRYTERLAEAGALTSVGSRGESYDNALAETMIGLYKTELIRRGGPWRGIDDVEYGTLEWIDWFNPPPAAGADRQRPTRRVRGRLLRRTDPGVADETAAKALLAPGSSTALIRSAALEASHRLVSQPDPPIRELILKTKSLHKTRGGSRVVERIPVITRRPPDRSARPTLEQLETHRQALGCSLNGVAASLRRDQLAVRPVEYAAGGRPWVGSGTPRSQATPRDCGGPTRTCSNFGSWTGSARRRLTLARTWTRRRSRRPPCT